MNPGTDVPWDAEPGRDCNDPGPYNGRFSKGNPFPNYISTALCGDKSPEQGGQMRVTYQIYYVYV